MGEDGWSGIRRPARRPEAPAPDGVAVPAVRHAWDVEELPRPQPAAPSEPASEAGDEDEEEARDAAGDSRLRWAARAGRTGSGPRAPDVAGAPQWTANLQIQRLLTIGMAACAGWELSRTLVSVGAGESRALSIFFLTVITFAAGVALGGRGEARHYRRYTDYGLTDWLLLLVPIVLVLKLLPALLQGPAAAGAEIASWTRDPAHFGDTYLVWGLLLVFGVWDLSLRVAEDLNLLSLQPGETPPTTINSPAYYDWLTSPYRFIDHAGAWERLMWTFTSGGFLVLLFAGLAAIPAGALTDPNRAEVHGTMPPVLIYYLLGLLLASQSSLDRLRTDWLRSGAQVQPGLARRWLAYGAALIAMALALALLLPTSTRPENASLLPVVGWLLWPIQLLFALFNWIIAHVAAVLFAPFGLLFGAAAGAAGAGQSSGAGPVPTPRPLPVEPAPAGYPSISSRIVWGLLLYVAPAALALYAVWNTWRKRREIARGAVTFGRDLWTLLKGGLLDLLALLWRVFSFDSPRLMRFAPEAIRQRLRRRPRLGGSAARAGWLRLRGLDPRGMIHYFYVSTAQRAEGLGWARRNGETPYEYSRELARRVPERRAELEQLTEAFVRARYSRRPVDAADARRARTPWERLRGALQTRRRAGQVGSWLGLGKDQPD